MVLAPPVIRAIAKQEVERSSALLDLVTWARGPDAEAVKRDAPAARVLDLACSDRGDFRSARKRDEVEATRAAVSRWKYATTRLLFHSAMLMVPRPLGPRYRSIP